MDMLGVTIGIGSKWKECAERAAFLMRLNTGLECYVVSALPRDWEINEPHWFKLWVQDQFPGQDLMIFDADIISTQSWNPVKQLGSYDMAWVLDRGPSVLAECVRRGLDSTKYGNSGMILIKSGCSILQQSRNYYPDMSAWFEQTAINLTVQSHHNFQVKTLSNRYNLLIRKHCHQKAIAGHYKQSYNLHFVGLYSSPERLKKLFELQEHFIGLLANLKKLSNI